MARLIQIENDHSVQAYEFMLYKEKSKISYSQNVELLLL